MPSYEKTKNILSLKFIPSAKPGKYHDGDGLYLLVSDTGKRSWMRKFQIGGRSREMGLGPCALVTLAEARKLHFAAPKLLRSGVDPIEARTQGLRLAVLAGSGPTFKERAHEYIEVHKAGGRLNMRSIGPRLWPCMPSLS